MGDTTGKNYYELLGVSRTASLEEIKDAYKELAKIFHPDSHFFSEITEMPASPEAMSTFKALTAAYSTLSNPEKRKEYDAGLPPALDGWDEETGDSFHTDIKHKTLQKAVSEERSPLLKSFGKCEPSEKSQEEKEEESEEGDEEEVEGEKGAFISAFKKLFRR